MLNPKNSDVNIGLNNNNNNINININNIKAIYGVYFKTLPVEFFFD